MSIHTKLLAVKEGLPYLQKLENGYQYSYNSPSQVLAAVNPLLNAQKLFLKTEVLSVETEMIKTGTTFDKNLKAVVDKMEILYKSTMLFTFIDTETGERDENRFFAAGVNNMDKGFGSSLTYGERYFLLKYFNIPVDGDDPDAFQEKQLTQKEKDEISKASRYKDIEGWIFESDTLKRLGAVWLCLSKEEQEDYSDIVETATLALRNKNKKK